MKSLCKNSKRPLVNLEAVVWRCSVEKVLLKTSQNSAENTSARVSFLVKFHMTYGLQVDFGKQIFHRHFRKCCRQKNGESKFRLDLRNEHFKDKLSTKCEVTFSSKVTHIHPLVNGILLIMT